MKTTTLGGVARQLLAGSLLNEIAVHIAPMLLGAGVHLYGALMVRLERIAATLSPQLTDLPFRVAR